MKKFKKKGNKVAFWIIWILYIVSLVCTFTIPIDNPNLRIVFSCVDDVPRDIYVHYTNTDVEVNTYIGDNYFEFEGINYCLANGGQVEIKIGMAGNENLRIRDVKVYRNHIKVNNIDPGEMGNYSYIAGEGVSSCGEDNILVLSGDKIDWVLNERFVVEMYDISASVLIERFIVSGVLSVLLVLLLFLNRILNRKNWELLDEFDPYNSYTIKNETIRFFKDMKRYFYYMVYSAKTDLSAEVADSYLNWIWWLLEPFFNMLVYVIVFSKVMETTIDNYSIFVFSALLMWNFFNKAVNYSVKLVRNNKDIVTKVYIPKFVLLLSNMFLNLFKFLFSLIILVGMIVIFKVKISYTIIFAAYAFLELFLVSFGLGMILLHFGVFIDDFAYAVGILLNMLMFLSGIFYDLESGLWYPLNKIMLYCNPVAMTIDCMRKAILFNQVPNQVLMGAWLVISIVLCCIGVHIVYKNENGYVKIV